MGSVALSLVPTWRSSEEGAAAPTWTCPVRGASSASVTARLGPQDHSRRNPTGAACSLSSLSYRE